MDPVARKKNSAFLLRLLCCVYFFLLISVFLTIPGYFYIVEIENLLRYLNFGSATFGDFPKVAQVSAVF